MKQRPLAIGLLLCEQIIIEEKTRNVTLVNCFTLRTVEQIPYALSFVAYAVLTDGAGEIPLEVRILALIIWRRSINEPYPISLLIHLRRFVVLSACAIVSSQCPALIKSCFWQMVK